MKFSRRTFLRSAAASVSIGGVSYFLPPFPAASGDDTPKPSEQIRIASIGVGNQGTGNTKIHVKNIVAVCDVDTRHLANADQAGREGRRQDTRRRRPTTASCSNARTSTPSSSPRPTTGTR